MKDRRAASAHPAPARVRRSRLRGRLLALLIAIAAIVAILRFWRRTPSDPLARVTEAAASDSVEAMFAANRFADALPYFRRLERIAPQNSYLFHARYAATLQNAAVESRRQDGLDVSRFPLSAERIGMLREAMAELDRAESLAPSDQQRGDVAASRAWMLGLWGFWRESYLEFRRADQIRPLVAEEQVEARWVDAMLRDPTQEAPSPFAR